MTLTLSMWLKESEYTPYVQIDKGFRKNVSCAVYIYNINLSMWLEEDEHTPYLQ